MHGQTPDTSTPLVHPNHSPIERRSPGASRPKPAWPLSLAGMTLIKTLAASLALGCAGSAQAALLYVEEWSFEHSVYFDIATIMPVDGVDHQGDPVNKLIWGTPENLGGPRSSLEILEIESAGTIETTTNRTELKDINTFTLNHYNANIRADSPQLRSIDIISDLTLTPLHPLGDGEAVLLRREFTVYFLETPNAPAICADGTPNGQGITINGCADIFNIDRAVVDFEFQYPGLVESDGNVAWSDETTTYYLSFVEIQLGNNPMPWLSESACLAVTNGMNSRCLGFLTAERTHTLAPFSIVIANVPIPEPGSIAPWSLGLSALGLGLRRRRIGSA